MVFIPLPESPALPNPPDLNPVYQTVMNRELTHWFISLDPTVISLVPRERVKSGSGGMKFVEKTPRPQQILKLINQGGTSGGLRTATDGLNRQFDMVLLGEWDATIEIGDIWEDPGNPGNFWEVYGLEPYNGYEVKAAVRAFGKKLEYGG